MGWCTNCFPQEPPAPVVIPDSVSAIAEGKLINRIEADMNAQVWNQIPVNTFITLYQINNYNSNTRGDIYSITYRYPNSDAVRTLNNDAWNALEQVANLQASRSPVQAFMGSPGNQAETYKRIMIKMAAVATAAIAPTGHKIEWRGGRGLAVWVNGQGVVQTLSVFEYCIRLMTSKNLNVANWINANL